MGRIAPFIKLVEESVLHVVREGEMVGTVHARVTAPGMALVLFETDSSTGNVTVDMAEVRLMFGEPGPAIVLRYDEAYDMWINELEPEEPIGPPRLLALADQLNLASGESLAVDEEAALDITRKLIAAVAQSMPEPRQSRVPIHEFFARGGRLNRP